MNSVSKDKKMYAEYRAQRAERDARKRRIYPRMEELNDLIGRKLVTRRVHPHLPLWIHNYTPEAQSLPPAQWSECLKDCRGLVLAEDSDIVARPFRKFWNMEQMLDMMPAEQPVEVWEKMDGSLGICTAWIDPEGQGHMIVATRGSFESEQARWFADWLHREKRGFLPAAGETWLFELIYPENRIVVDYGERREAVLLTALKNKTGEDLPETEINRVATHWNFSRPARYTSTGTLVALASSMDDNPRFAGQEGFVARFANGLRVKLKLTEYKRLHRLVTQCSTRTIWELLRSGKSLSELLANVPSDFSRWVADTANRLTGEFGALRASVCSGYNFHYSTSPVNETRKDFALWATRQKYPHLLFMIRDGQDISDAVWKLVEPEWATPFRQEAERDSIIVIDDPGYSGPNKEFFTREVKAA